MAIKINNENELSSQIIKAIKADFHVGTNSNGEVYFKLTVGLAVAGGSLLLLFIIIMSVICNRKGYCKRNCRRRNIYNQPLRGDDLEAVDGMSFDTNNLNPMCSKQLTSIQSTSLQIIGSNASGSTKRQLTAQDVQQFIQDLQNEKNKSTQAQRDLDKKIKSATASLQKIQKNHPSSTVLSTKRNGR